MENQRQLVFYKNYFEDFFDRQNVEVKKKILWTFKRIETEPRIQKDFFKFLKNTLGLYEIRIQFGGNQYRIFCFFTPNRIIVLGNGFHKKTQKTPQKAIKKANKIKIEYESEYKIT